MATFEELLKDLGKKSLLLDQLSQVKDGKLWSALIRKKGTTKVGYASDKTYEGAIKKAAKNMRDKFSDSDWKKFAKEQSKSKPKKKRTRL